jgi:DNA repair exonuclease SbcCD ATPase subunit
VAEKSKSKNKTPNYSSTPQKSLNFSPEQIAQIRAHFSAIEKRMAAIRAIIEPARHAPSKVSAQDLINNWQN